MAEVVPGSLPVSGAQPTFDPLEHLAHGTWHRPGRRGEDVGVVDAHVAAFI